MALKIMNARFAFLFVRGVSPSSLPLPDRPSVRRSLPWRLKSDPLSLYFSLSMAPATATTHREVHHCDKQVALLTVDTLFAKWSTSLWPARGEFPIRERPVITHLERTVARVCDTCLRTIRLHHRQVLFGIAIYYCPFFATAIGQHNLSNYSNCAGWCDDQG